MPCTPTQRTLLNMYSNIFVVPIISPYLNIKQGKGRIGPNLEVIK
ncbi:MAG: hypothetical protein PWQ88_1274 [Candidatus Methanomethylophilaceae archaeon]|nr:hypothetical protein [Candidatus Methanomethylophilaceae archaeon]MDI3541483.1 hypothetical protein [Candidatus Methanomethylophilaceae archaeon]